MAYAYTFGGMGNITVKATEHGSYNYDYDDLYRLSTAETPDTPDEDFTYDPVGNRLTASDTTGDWAYNDNNELESNSNTSYVYDANANMTRKTVSGVVTLFFYNIEDRLEHLENGSGQISGQYCRSYSEYDPKSL